MGEKTTEKSMTEWDTPVGHPASNEGCGSAEMQTGSETGKNKNGNAFVCRRAHKSATRGQWTLRMASQ